jgi:tRNA-dihydrouridine synthase 4
LQATTRLPSQPSPCVLPLSVLHSTDPIFQEFTRICGDTGLLYPLFHRHVAYMIESHLPTKHHRTYFNSLPSHASVIDYCEDFLGVDMAVGNEKRVE